AVRDEPAKVRALKDEIARGRQRAAARFSLVRNAPAGPLIDGIPREEEARRADGLARARLVLRLGQRAPIADAAARREIDGDVPCIRAKLEVGIRGVNEAALVRGNVDEPGLG